MRSIRQKAALFTPSGTANCRSLSAATLGCWLLIFVLALDLVSSPLHKHSHDLGGDISEASSIHIGQIAGDEHALHVEIQDAHYGHSLAFLLPRQLQPAQARLLAAPYLALPPMEELRSDFGALTDELHEVSEHIPILPDRYLRPNNRAPPTLHS